MRLILFAWFLTLIACTGPAQNEVSNTEKWYKGNLHTHSFWSDGDEFPEMIMSWYKDHGYHFLALTDHNILADKDYWIEMDDSLRQAVFARYLDKYGASWVIYQADSGNTRVKLKTIEEYRGLFEEEERFLIFQAEEISDRFEDKPLHLNATNIETLIEPQGGNSVVEVLQRNINALYRQRESTGRPMIIHINHPNFHYAITVEDLIALQGERFFELYNGHPVVYNLGDSVHIDTETMWDQVNIAYADSGKPLLYGLATDDSHNYHQQGKSWSNSGRGWIQVQADTLSAGALIEAMEQGKFYASTGVALEKVEWENNTLTIKADATGGNYKIQFIGCTAGSSETKVLKQASGPEASFNLTGDHLFVRAKIISDRLQENPVEGLAYQTAWTQPVRYQDRKQ